MSPSYTADKLRMGQQIKDARKALGKSQERCASEVGVSRRHWIRWELGEHMPDPMVVPRIAAAVGVDESFFSDEEEGDSLHPRDFLDALYELVREHRSGRSKGRVLA